MYRIIILSFIILSLISGCAGSGNNVNGSQVSDPIAQAQTQAQQVIEEILATRSNDSNEGIRKRTTSSMKVIWFDPNLSVAENVTALSDYAKQYGYSGMQMEQGSYGVGTAVAGTPIMVKPIGSATYNGDAIFSYWITHDYTDWTGKVKEAYPTPRIMAGSASMTLDFDNNTGSLSATSDPSSSKYLINEQITGDVVGTAQLEVNISSIDADGNIVGQGNFNNSGETYRKSSWHNNLNSGGGSYLIDPSDNRLGWLVYENVDYKQINETSTFQGSLFGPNGQEAGGISMGNSHEVGVVLK